MKIMIIYLLITFIANLASHTLLVKKLIKKYNKQEIEKFFKTEKLTCTLCEKIVVFIVMFTYPVLLVTHRFLFRKICKAIEESNIRRNDYV